MIIRSRALLTIATLVAAMAALVGSGQWPATTSAAALASTTVLQRCPWMDAGMAPDQRARLLLAALETDQKIQMVHGRGLVNDVPVGPPGVSPLDTVPEPGGRGAGWLAAVPELCVPAQYYTDGGAGVSDGATGVTAFPEPIAQAASFDPGLIYDYGRELARQVRGKGMNGLLGPSVNGGRDPRWNRNFEGIGGEDPYLQGTLGASMIRGLQSRPVIGVIKHYAGYDAGQPTNAAIDERTQQELYIKPFEAAVRAGAGSVMCSYNEINGTPACENAYTLGHLRRTLGFTGSVMSDWGGTHSTVASANNGLTLEMAGGNFFGKPLSLAVQLGEVDAAQLDRMVFRNLLPMFKQGLFDHPPIDPAQSVRTAHSRRLALRMAETGTVLLKNRDDVLPLRGRDSRVAVIGTPASADGAMKYYQAARLDSHVELAPEDLSVPLDAIRTRARQRGSMVTYNDGSDPASAAADAAAANVAVVFVYTDEGGQGNDRLDLKLPDNQDALVRRVAEANDHTVVVLASGGPAEMPWLADVASVMAAWFPGEQFGNAIANVLFGISEPGGRLPQTFPLSLDDEPAANNPDRYLPVTPRYNYSEGLYIGYRWFDRQDLPVLFPFGYGLSYTKFKYTGFRVPAEASGRAPLTVQLTVQNVGGQRGSDVPQIYVGWPARGVDAPKRQLRGFTRVRLRPGEARRLSITLDPRAFSYWDTTLDQWRVQVGCYPVWAGHSSRKLVHMQEVAVGGASC